jgi:hypothetical protein
MFYARLEFPCHHSMARPRVADGRDGLQLWSVAANILNKQPDKRQGSVLQLRGWSWGLQQLTVTNRHITKDLYEIWTCNDSLGNHLCDEIWT